MKYRGCSMKKLLVVVDFQNDFVDGSLGFSGAEQLEQPICQKIFQYRAEGAQVAFTFDTHGADYLDTQEGRLLPIPHCTKSTQGWDLYGKVAGLREADDPCFEKSAFGSPELAHYVAKNGFERVELCGLVSNICVISNAVLIKASLPEAEVVVDAACTSCADPEMNRKALDVMEGLQIRVIGR